MLVVAAFVVLLGLTGCARGAGGESAGPAADTSDLSWDAQALEQIGFNTADLSAASADPSPSASPGKKDRRGALLRHRRLRLAFGKKMLHGEAVVQTDEGTKTIVVQRGTVTAIDSTTITVKSADGFTLTWKFGDPLRVIESRKQIQPSAVAVGATVGVAGAKDGDTPVARLVVIRR
jgi:hypothetical protein